MGTHKARFWIDFRNRAFPRTTSTSQEIKWQNRITQTLAKIGGYTKSSSEPRQKKPQKPANNETPNQHANLRSSDDRITTQNYQGKYHRTKTRNAIAKPRNKRRACQIQTSPSSTRNCARVNGAEFAWWLGVGVKFGPFGDSNGIISPINGRIHPHGTNTMSCRVNVEGEGLGDFPRKVAKPRQCCQTPETFRQTFLRPFIVLKQALSVGSDTLLRKNIPHTSRMRYVVVSSFLGFPYIYIYFLERVIIIRFLKPALVYWSIISSDTVAKLLSDPFRKLLFLLIHGYDRWLSDLFSLFRAIQSTVIEGLLAQETSVKHGHKEGQK